MALQLILGNKNYSSWSFRPWLALTVAGIPFEETVLPIYIAGAREKILEHSPSGKVPVLIDGAVHVWESLAIIEYAAEKFPAAGLWPQASAARAHARAVANEMHGGFLPLRRACPMNMRREPGAIALSADVLANVARIDEIWTDCRARHRGPVPVRRVRRGGRDVRAGGVALSHLCGRGRADRARLYGAQ